MPGMKRVQKMLAVCPVCIALFLWVATSQMPSCVSSEPLRRVSPVPGSSVRRAWWWARALHRNFKGSAPVSLKET